MYVFVCVSVCVCDESHNCFLVPFATCTVCYSSVLWCGLDIWLVKFDSCLFVVRRTAVLSAYVGMTNMTSIYGDFDNNSCYAMCLTHKHL